MPIKNKLKKTELNKIPFTNEDINDMLRNYERIEISDLKLGMNIRYFIYDDKVELFRIGGKIMKIDPNKKYIILTNGNKNWSVQLHQKIDIYGEIDINDIENKYKKKINELLKEIKLLTEKKNKHKENEVNLVEAFVEIKK